ncbi:MAG: biotin carboxylase N-terminal domain-containing protein [Enterobacteriaceae bacterium]|nr:biotin carboxylase N-terminal domain-containing protein [Enterobacteriaceae bacterium]
MHNKILIANRGEIALRILRCCKKLNIKTTAIYSTTDKNLIHIYQANESICIGSENPKNSYLNTNNIISAAEISGCDAIHPGYGFLSENAAFAEQTTKSNIIFIGPSANSIKLMSNKPSAIEVMKKHDIECLSFYKCGQNKKDNITLANKIGYPIILKIAHGGGGKGIRIVESDKNFKKELETVKKEANMSFKNSSIYMEKYLNTPRHIEIQILKDQSNNMIFLGERECTVQQNHQKIIEETPVTNINKKLLNEIKKKCIIVCNEINYYNAGTFEFLYENNKFFFIEMNTRLQVEHTITEMVTGIDIVENQIKISAKEKLNIKQKDIKILGHAIECRINIVNPKKTRNKITFLHIPSGNGIRFDSHIYNGYEIPIHYDALLGKLITYGNTRIDAINKMISALDEITIFDIETNIQKLKNIILLESFKTNTIHTNLFK